MSLKYIASQIFAIGALIISIILAFRKRKSSILFFSSLSFLFFAVQYLLLSGYTGCIMNLIYIIDSLILFIQEKQGKKPNVITFISLLILGAVGLIITWNGILTALIAFAYLIYLISVWQSSVTVYKWLTIITIICWTIYNIALKSVFGTITENVVLTSNIVGLVEWYKINKKKEN